MNKFIIICVLWFAAGSLALAQTAAQLSPAAAPFSAQQSGYVAHNTAAKSSPPGNPSAPQPPAGQANAALQQPDRTKVVRIYGGAGYFNDALAEKLRPMLAKAFTFSRSDPLKPAPGEATASRAKFESQTKVTGAPHL